MEKGKTLNIAGLPWYLCLGACVLVFVAAYSGALTTDVAGALAFGCAVSALLYEFGERLPIWNSYIGGGLLMVFFGTAVLIQFNILPDKYAEAIGEVIQGSPNLLNIFIVFLITGSILSLDRKILLQSFAGYIPAILGGLACAVLFGVIVGAIFGISPTNIIIKYALPIMGGGNGAGAVPLSQIYEGATGGPAASYYSHAIIILTIANVICIIAGGLLNKLGSVKPSLTGDKKTLMRNAGTLAKKDEKVASDTEDLRGAFFLALTAFAVGSLFSKRILPSIAGAQIHAFAYTILFVVILAATGIVPRSVCAGAKRLQTFMIGVFGIPMMVAMGVDFDLMELASALSPVNLIIAVAVVLGAILGSALVGYLVGFYPIDSAVTAGLCMANRGGSGDIAVLGAADRLDLIAYAQLSSRIGGGIVLVVASVVFSFAL